MIGNVQVKSVEQNCQCPFCIEGICTKIDLGGCDFRYACPRCFSLFHLSDWELDNGKLLRKTQKITPPIPPTQQESSFDLKKALETLTDYESEGGF